MQMGEPASPAGANGAEDAAEHDRETQPLQFEICLQDVPGPDGLPLSFTPWLIYHGETELQDGETDEAGIAKIEVPANYRKKTLWLSFPGRVLCLKIHTGSQHTLTLSEEMSSHGYNVDSGMQSLPGHRKLEEYIYHRDKQVDK